MRTGKSNIVTLRVVLYNKVTLLTYNRTTKLHIIWLDIGLYLNLQLSFLVVQGIDRIV